MIAFTRPIIIFDVESTGLNKETDRIVEISAVKIFDNTGHNELRTKRLNPGIPIPPEATAIHGITNEAVATCTTFKRISNSLHEFFTGCDIGGFGCLFFDVPILYYEFLRAGITWDYQSVNIIDCGNIFKRMEPRDLTAAVKFYCNAPHQGAHGAEADATATANVFLQQLQRYPELSEMTASELAVFSNFDKKILDVSGKFVYDEKGVILLNFGPHKGKPANDNLDFVQWMEGKDFAPDTFKIVNQLLYGV